jgi:hypothetical protein
MTRRVYFDTNFDLGRFVKLCDRLGEINHELTHPPRRGLSKLEITSEDMSYKLVQFSRKPLSCADAIAASKTA